MIRLPIGQFGSSFTSSNPRDGVPRVPPLTFLRNNQNTEEIYITSASSISIDAPLSSIGSDSGIYNSSTSSASGLTTTRRTGAWKQNVRTEYIDTEVISLYDWQDVCIWLEEEEQPQPTGEEEEVYETIYDIIPADQQSDSDFDDMIYYPGLERGRKKQQLTKIASAANRRIKKLRRNWSLKKGDFTRSFSKIRKPSGQDDQNRTSSQFYVTGENESNKGEESEYSDIKKLHDLVELVGTDNTDFIVTLTYDLPPRKSSRRRSTQVDATYMQMNGVKEASRTSPPNRTSSYTPINTPQTTHQAFQDLKPSKQTPLQLISQPTYSNFMPTNNVYNRTKSAVDLIATATNLCHTSRASSRQSIDNSSIYATSDYVSYSSTDYQSSTDGNMSYSSPMKKSADAPNRPSRRKSRRNTQVILRPNVPPPAPPMPPPLPSDPPPNVTPPQPSSPQTPPKLPSSHPPPLFMALNESPLFLAASKQSLFMAETLAGNNGNLAGKTSNESENKLEGTYAHHLINSEPLYQFYDGYVTKNTLTQNIDHTYESLSTTPYQQCDIISDEPMKSDNAPLPMVPPPATINSNIKSLEPLSKSTLDLFGAQGRRTLWSEIDEVRHSGVLETLSENDRKLQEAKFEILSSEASYLKSLNVLTGHFLPILAECTVEEDIYRLFSNIHLVKSCSERFLSEMNACWRQSVLLPGISRILLENGKKHFRVYVKYCTAQLHQEKTLRRLMSENVKFCEALKSLESSQACQSLSLHSFLMLPMQRVTRYPLLVNALMGRLNLNSSEQLAARECLDVLNSLVDECNEGARIAHREEELELTNRILDFRELNPVNILSEGRWLVKTGTASRIHWKESTESVRLTFGKRNSKQSLVLYLFTDLLVLAKKKSDEKHAVIDYCTRNLIQTSVISRHDTHIPGVPDSAHPMWLTLLQNCEKRTQEMLVYFQTANERQLWIDLLDSKPKEENGELIYSDWDTPIVEITTPQKFENVVFNLKDTARVLRKKEELLLLEKSGYAKARTWVHQHCTRELTSEHLRANNFKQRYQFLQSLSLNGQ